MKASSRHVRSCLHQSLDLAEGVYDLLHPTFLHYVAEGTVCMFLDDGHKAAFDLGLDVDMVPDTNEVDRGDVHPFRAPALTASLISMNFTGSTSGNDFAPSPWVMRSFLNLTTLPCAKAS